MALTDPQNPVKINMNTVRRLINSNPPAVFKQKPSHRLDSNISQVPFHFFDTQIVLWWGTCSIALADSTDVYPLWERNVRLQTYTSLFSETHTPTLGTPTRPFLLTPLPSRGV